MEKWRQRKVWAQLSFFAGSEEGSSKSENRRPKLETMPKAETRKPISSAPAGSGTLPAHGRRGVSAFGFRLSNLVRLSGYGLWLLIPLPACPQATELRPASAPTFAPGRMASRSRRD